MDIKELNSLVDIPMFDDVVENKELLDTKEKLDILQVNIGRICNLQCKHCHVDGGPHRTEVMSRETLELCLEVFKKHNFSIMDITGGAPEMVPDFEWFVEECSKIADKVIVRTNLVILLSDKYKHLIDVYKNNKVNVVCSVPFYSKKNTDIQRGDGVFEKSIEVMKILNGVGYGIKPELVLDVVYNPNGAFLPPTQAALESLYKQKFYSNYGVVFNNLYTITNNPVGKFGDFLKENEILEDYMNTLYYSFNPSTVENLMCRNQVSVSWDGYLYDCDFNQAVDIKVNGKNHLKDLLEIDSLKRRIVTAKHCYGCTAGLGSSCGGTISE